MLKAIHAQESSAAADHKAKAIIEDLRAGKMSKAADLVEQAVHETLTYYAFPDIHWQKIFEPTTHSSGSCGRSSAGHVWWAHFQMANLVSILLRHRLRYIAGTAWSAKRYMNMQPLYAAAVNSETGAVA